jgi:hypothetical protein
LTCTFSCCGYGEGDSSNRCFGACSAREIGGSNVVNGGDHRPGVTQEVGLGTTGRACRWERSGRAAVVVERAAATSQQLQRDTSTVGRAESRG